MTAMTVITKSAVDEAAARYRKNPSRANRIALRDLAADHAIALEDARVALNRARAEVVSATDHQMSFQGIRDLNRHEPYLRALDRIRDARRAVRAVIAHLNEVQS